MAVPTPFACRAGIALGSGPITGRRFGAPPRQSDPRRVLGTCRHSGGTRRALRQTTRSCLRHVPRRKLLGGCGCLRGGRLWTLRQTASATLWQTATGTALRQASRGRLAARNSATRLAGLRSTARIPLRQAGRARIARRDAVRARLPSGQSARSLVASRQAAGGPGIHPRQRTGQR
ncbi:hypothetical protein, partial [Nocardia brevicatena]|uniref:hypothetical protein n=1 Tax=Nocardia brevicatena TaxID=37327 RepID=UPI001C3F366F